MTTLNYSLPNLLVPSGSDSCSSPCKLKEHYELQLYKLNQRKVKSWLSLGIEFSASNLSNQFSDYYMRFDNQEINTPHNL